MAIRSRRFNQGLIFKNDIGIQYANRKFAKMIESYGIIRKGNYWDNAVVESF